MIINKLDGVEFRLRERHDLSWLKRYGTAFWAVDETGSGCVCIGMEREGKRYFCKVAGVNTIEASVTPEKSVEVLKKAVPIYRELAHPSLVKLIESYGHGSFYAVIFEWSDGECLHDHWNFEKYKSDPALTSPKARFKGLPAVKKLRVTDTLFSFLTLVCQKGYAAVDFYDGSIMYNFKTDAVTICDVDFFRKKPVVNDMGEAWFGTERLKAPEEYIKGAIIDERTNIFTIGAMIFDFFGRFSDEEIARRYRDRRFTPCGYSDWQLNEAAYNAAVRAVSPDRNERYQTFAEFYNDWKEAIK